MKIKILLVILCSIFFLLPFLLWGNTYLVGGDDTRLYYIFPYQFLTHYAFNIISDNTLAGAMTGYASVSYFAPFFYLILIFKLVPVLSTQMILYGLNFVFGFLGFYFFLGLFIQEKDAKLIRMLGGIFYVSSIYLANTLYTNQLLSIYLVSTIPWTMYLFVKGIQENKMTFIFSAIALFSLLSTTINTLPWWGGFLITSLPLFIWLGIAYWRNSIKAVFLAGITFIVLNFFWIFHFLNSYFFNTGLHSTLQYYSSSAFIKDNLRIISGVSTLYNPLNVVFQQMDTNFTTHFSLFSLVGIVLFLPVLVAGLLLKTISTQKTIIYGVVLSCFILSWYLFSPGFGNTGPQIFLYLGQHVPFFTMFRNMFDKFALSVAFYFAFSLSYSLYILGSTVLKKYSSILIGIFFVGVVLFAIKSLYTIQRNTASYTHFSGIFNDDFIQLAQFLEKQPDASKIVWLPLNEPTYANISDKYNPRVIYSGLSPVHILTAKSDFAGRFSFITQSNLFLGDYVFDLLKQKQYAKLLSLFQQFNITYIVVNKENLPQNVASFMYGGEKKEILNWQDENLVKVLVGEKIKDFGKRYSLYKINQRFTSQRVYLTSNFNTFPQDFNTLHYIKNSSSLYTITISHLSNPENLVFLDPYYKDWTLYLVRNGTKIPFEEGKNQIVFGYANGWHIDPEIIKKKYPGEYVINTDGSMNIYMQLYFKPERYSLFANSISILGWSSISIFLSWQLWKERKKQL